MMLWFRSHYLGAAGEDGRLEDPHASPLCAQDLTGLPPAHIVTAEFDLLRDEGRAHAERLSVAGVEVSCHWHQGLIHGCANLVGGIPAARQAIDEACAAVRVAFARL